MKKPLLHVLLSLSLFPLAAGCAGVRHAGDTHTAHAESFHFLGLTIPGNDRDKAWDYVPEGAEVVTVQSTPLDWSSFVGVLTNLFGFSATEVTWTTAKE